MAWVNVVVQGILLGGLYALFATGLSLAFGVMRFVADHRSPLRKISARLRANSTGYFTDCRWFLLLQRRRHARPDHHDAFHARGWHRE